MKERSFDIAVIGELNPDLVLSGNIVPEFGRVEKLIDRAELSIGSSVGIFACGSARLGLWVAYIGVVGGDMYGQYMLQAVSERGVDTSGIPSGNFRGISSWVSGSSQSTIFFIREQRLNYDIGCIYKV